MAEFTRQDYASIDKAWARLMESARKRCKNEAELAVVQKAFEFSRQAHMNVRRRSGEPYILHPLAVAQIVVDDIGLGYKSISAALLHDVVEDTDSSIEDLRKLFGDKIATLVDGLTKIKKVLDNKDKNGRKDLSAESLQAENFKRILLTLNDDVRVVLIKLADRLHNCRTIEYMPEHKRDKILSETMFIFIPLAHRLGLYSIKTELENIWLRYQEPDAYAWITERIDKNIHSRKAEMEAFVQPIEEALTKAGFNFTIKKRIKTPYSVWHKMQVKQIPFEQVYDLYAIRIVFQQDIHHGETERDQCYHVFSIITSLYRYMPERLRDWVKHPKSNGYEALHCTLLSPSGIWVEVQIRTRRMDDIAEKGIAAHWAYKKTGYISENGDMDAWLRRIKEILVDPDVNALELLDMVHSDLTTTEIYVFTPKGEQKSIQKGATVLDFAYLIHTEIGNKAIAAKVNQRLVSLSHVIKTGDQIEIITAEEEHPKPEWLHFLKTRRALSAVKEYFKNERPAFSAGEPEQPRKKTGQTGYVIGGESGLHYIIASCCNPIPGDPVVGFKAPDGVITVHKKTCPVAESLASTHEDWMVEPSWIQDNESGSFLVRISLKGIDRMGMVKDISSYLSVVMGANIRGLTLTTDDGIFDGYIDLYVANRDVLETIIQQLSGIEGIKEVSRSEL